MFALDNTPATALALPGLALEMLPAPATTTQFDLSLALVEADGRLTGRIDYASDLFDASTIERWALHLATLLQAMVGDERTPVRRLPLRAPAQRAQVVQGFNDTACAFPRGLTVHALFEQQARRTPDAVALEFGEATQTYAELNARANRLANRLIALGVRPDDRVGVCDERSLLCGQSMLSRTTGVDVARTGEAHRPRPRSSGCTSTHGARRPTCE